SITARAVGFYDPTIAVSAAGEAHVTGKLRAPFRGDSGNAGYITISGNVVTLEAPANVNATSPDAGGFVRLDGGTVDLAPGTIIGPARGGWGSGGGALSRTCGECDSQRDGGRRRRRRPLSGHHRGHGQRQSPRRRRFPGRTRRVHRDERGRDARCVGRVVRWA